ncbi:MAG: cobalamin-binding protein, partial [Candidatus Marinimicrobia bacterium]|nr:cobalamin-binding protein [Candidatus Neomarinimicrobiota bacterium]
MSSYSLKREAESLPPIPLEAATSYHAHAEELIQYVNDSLTADADINSLIGNAPLQKMYDNHKHHAQFMSTIFSLNEYDILVGTLPWVYRTYHSHNFSYDYFPAAMKQWIAGIGKFLEPVHAEPILKVYRWLIEMHDQIIADSKSVNLEPPPVHPDWLEKKTAFQAALLGGDHHKCLDIASDMIADSSDIQQFYSQIVQPSLYEIGMLWEQAEISVAQEHLASAIVGRVMASVGMNLLQPSGVKGKAVITASPNEYHEIGGWMISDTLEQDG